MLDFILFGFLLVKTSYFSITCVNSFIYMSVLFSRLHIHTDNTNSVYVIHINLLIF